MGLRASDFGMQQLQQPENQSQYGPMSKRKKEGKNEGDILSIHYVVSLIILPVQGLVHSKVVARLQVPKGSLQNCKHQTSHLRALHEEILAPSTQAENKSKRVTC